MIRFGAGISVAHFMRRIVSGHTVGVRGVVVEDDRLLLVRHSYLPGWYLPGGAVEPGETVIEALHRELDEEAGIRPSGQPQLSGVYLNRKLAGRDHVLVFRIAAFDVVRAFKPTLEIREARFFALDSLPNDVSAGTRRRVDELFAGASVSADW